MKKLFLTSALLSVMAMPALAETKWFVGANVGYAEPVFSDVVDDQIDNDFWKDESGTVALSMTAGMRFGEHDKIYNGGVSATLSYMPDLGQLKDGDASPLYMDAELDFTTLYLSYDNYIKLSGDSKYRTDFIASVGLGYGWLEESLSIKGYGNETFDDDAMVLVLKFGFGGETKFSGLGWNVMLNMTVPNAEDDADLQGSYGIDFGVRYTF